MCAMNLANDLTIIYSGWPATGVLWIPKSGQGKTGRAILDQPGTYISGGDIIATDFGLRYPADTFPGVRQGDRFIVEGITYTARENAQPTQDGLEHTVPLARAGK